MGLQARTKEELTSELSVLDDTLKQLQTELSAGEAGRQEDRCSWVKHVSLVLVA